MSKNQTDLTQNAKVSAVFILIRVMNEKMPHQHPEAEFKDNVDQNDA